MYHWLNLNNTNWMDIGKMEANNQVEKKRNDMIDAGKTLACLAVMLIHCVFPGKTGVLLRTLSKFAVPFFFAISGYYNKGSITRKIKHMGYLCVISEIFYLVFDGVCMVFKETDMSAELFGGGTHRLLTAILRNIVFNTPFTSPHLWFLYALLYCYLLSTVLRRMNDKTKLLLSFALITTFTVTSEFSGILGINNRLNFELSTGEIIGSYIYNLFIFRAYPFFVLGELFRKHEKKSIRFFTGRKLVYCAALGIVLASLERLIFMESQFYVGTYLFTIAMFVFCIKFNGRIFCGDVWKRIVQFGKESSVYVYIIHIAIYDLIRYIFSLIVTGKKTGMTQSIEVLITIVVTCLLANTISLVKKRIKRFNDAL